jgi:His/Glu/Gln/Arg/opine family amino acid ABC transporter permease subunit
MELFNPWVAVASLGPLLAGMLITVELTVVVILLSLALGLAVALARLYGPRPLVWLVVAYVEVVRGTPLLLQLIYIYYVLPELGIRLDAFAASVIGLTLNYSAYISEVYRSGIQGVAKGQGDAAFALGMTRPLALRRIILPQAVRLVTPALGNFLISLFKDTALCSVVSVQEVLFTAQLIAARNYQYFTLYTVVGVLYFGVGFAAARLVDHFERRSRAGYGRRRRRPARA